MMPILMTSEVEERPRLVTGGYGRRRSQWVNRYQMDQNVTHKYFSLVSSLNASEGTLESLFLSSCLRGKIIRGF